MASFKIDLIQSGKFQSQEGFQKALWQLKMPKMFKTLKSSKVTLNKKKI